MSIEHACFGREMCNVAIMLILKKFCWSIFWAIKCCVRYLVDILLNFVVVDIQYNPTGCPANFASQRRHICSSWLLLCPTHCIICMYFTLSSPHLPTDLQTYFEMDNVAQRFCLHVCIWSQSCPKGLIFCPCGALLRQVLEIQYWSACLPLVTFLLKQSHYYCIIV